MTESALREGLLQGVTVAIAGYAPGVTAACEALGAATPVVDADLRDERSTAAAIAALGSVDVLVCASPDVDGSFVATRAAAGVWIEAGRGGKVVLLAPVGDAMARAALENLARTLSVEWARFAITPTAVLPGPGTAPAEVGELVAFLASPAGDYCSGCAFALGTVG